MSRFLSLIFLLFICTSASAGNLAREAVTALEVKKKLGSGEIVELGSGDKSFIAVYEQSTLALKQGGIILLHDIDENPDSPLVMRTLRTRLTANGWDTLSLLMPMAGRQSPRDVYYTLKDESIYRISEAVKFFEKKNNINLGLVGHGMGANMAAQFQAATPLEGIRGIVMINSDAKHASTEEALKVINVPIFDLFGSQSHDRVKDTAVTRKRAIAFTAGNLNYRQYRQLGADDDFRGLQDQLYLSVRAWLGKNIAGQEIILRKNERK